MSSDEPKAIAEAETALKKYCKGMKDLGMGLLVLAVFQLVVGAAFLALRFEPLILAILGGMAAIHLIMGLLILRNHGWANYLVAVWSVLLVASFFVRLGVQGEQQTAGSNPGGWVGLVIAAALLYYSLNNLSSLRKVRALGLEPKCEPMFLSPPPPDPQKEKESAHYPTTSVADNPADMQRDEQRKEESSLLKAAEDLYHQEKWEEARVAFEKVLGDPSYGQNFEYAKRSLESFRKKLGK